MKSNITLTGLLLSSNVDLTKDKKIINQNIFYKNNIYTSNSDPIIFNTISASIILKAFIDTQRYITLNELSSIFLFSNNIDFNNISFSIDNYNLLNNTIKLDSISSIDIPISAYYNTNNKQYFLNSTNILVSAYTYDYQFNTDLINYIIPLNKNFLYNLNNLYYSFISTAPKTSISTYLVLNNPSAQIFEDLETTNIFKGKILNNYKNYIKNNNISGFSNIIDAKYYKNLLNKSYKINLLNYNCYFVDSLLISSYIWLTTSELLELYIKARKLLNINYNIFNNYGLSSLYTSPRYLAHINKSYYYNNLYILQNTYNNASKLLLDITVNADNINILSDQISAYVYYKPNYTDKKIYYIYNQNTIPSSQFILSFNVYPGTNIWITDNNIKQNYINMLQTSAIHNINYYVLSIIDKNLYLIGSSIVLTYPLNINFNLNITYIRPNLTNIFLSSYLTSNTSSLIFENISNLQYYSINCKNTELDLYNILLSSNYNKNTNLNTIRLNIDFNLYYNDETNKEKYLLSTLQFKTVKYGNFVNTCLKEYNVITNNSNITLRDIRNLSKEHVLDINTFTEYTFDNNLTITLLHLTVPWLKYNSKTNIITNNLSTVNELTSYIKDIRNNNISYITVQDINTYETIKYFLYPRNIIKLPGQSTLTIILNLNYYNISHTTQLRTINYPINISSIILNSNNLEIIFNNYILNTPAQTEFNISGIYNTLPKTLLLNAFDSNYILSGEFFNTDNTSIKMHDIDFGSLHSNILIYPKNIKYNNSTIDLLPTYSLTYNIIPLNYPIENNEYDYVYYGQYKLNYYGKVEVLTLQDIVIDLNKVFASTANINSNKIISISKENIKNELIILPAKIGYINYILLIKIK